MRVIVGLGNPGTQYDWTPHNIGFLAIDAIAERAGIRVTRPESKSHVGLGKLAGQDVVLAKSQTFMNLSGGRVRICERGSAGGHNGLNSIIGSLGTNEFIRIRLGVGPEHPLGDKADHVLGVMRKPEREIAAQMAVETAEAVEMILTEGVGQAMTRFNKRVESAEKDSE